MLSEGSYSLYVVDNTTWTDQKAIPARISETANSISVNSSGNIATQAIWSNAPGTESYDIVIDVDSDGKFDFNYDFVDHVTLTAGFTLPVELSVFTADSMNGSVMLTWRTESEVNNIGFAIYRDDGKEGQYAVPYWLPKDTHVTIIIYNARGQAVRILDLGAKQAGEYVILSKAARWDGRDDLGEKVASGVYFYTLKAGEFSATRKMLIVK
ncbi:MAG: FlgD immunoglobulin-like domain containing protein [Candidatus Poribacteria bacterium]